MSAKFLIFFIPIGCIIALTAFQYAPKVSRSNLADSISFKQPSNFPVPAYDLKHNPITTKGFLLGKALFYDPSLSADGTVACGNCHQASAAFANLGSAVSKGIKGCKGSRNAPPLFNLAWQKEYMWDGRINAMQLVPVNALTNPCEMGNSIDKLLLNLQKDNSYPSRFKEVFGSSKITQQMVLDALSQFTAMLISANSKYDRYMRHEAGASFTLNEEAGYEFFKQKCASCHTEPLFTDLSYRNNGLEETSIDIGRDSLTHQRSDNGKFRVPTLRNIEITGPYMHDGRFYSLKEVLQHYNAGMKKHANLDKVFTQNQQPGIAISATEQTQIIAFLKTLTDVDFINDRRFNNH
ncbi:c-type cytochrome [Mucilaginibacter sp. R11]|uniref:C-type cytochrome n=1 Tax=Mucilaginibacter agri TaxID=2695265 RepID=A0A965ZJ32_9SPHI|nr:c-type cytochrome [Mucilaginibacter agri]